MNLENPSLNFKQPKSVLLLIFILLLKINVSAQWAQANINASTAAYLSDIKFTSSTTGFCVGQEGVFKTTDSGNNWSLINPSPPGIKIFFVNSSLGFVVDLYHLSKTTNGGATWTQAYDFSSSGETLKDVFFTTSNTGYLITSFYNNPATSFIYKTTNGGTAWTKTNSFPGLVTVESIKFVSQDTGFAVGYEGKIIKTYNGGISWTLNQIPNVETLMSVSFPKSHVGYAAGYSDFSGSEIIKTTDAGNSWQKLPTGGIFNSALFTVYFHSVDTGYAAGQDGRIIRTFNGGLTWQVCTLPVFHGNFHSIYFTKSTVGFVAGDYGVLLTTMNGGIDGIAVNEANKFNIFPNPAINTITIKSKNGMANKYVLAIKNAIGQEITSNTIEFTDTYTLELENLSNGIYFLSLQNDKEKIVQKILIQQ